MINSTTALAGLAAEFAAHAAKGVSEPFQPSLAASTGLSMLTRDLETKRQLGSLADGEKSLLSDISLLWEDIARYNSSRPDKVYSLKDSKFVPAPAAAKAEIPVISREQAEEIISGLNQQFEEKIAASRTPAEGGRNLQDYLTHVQGGPRLPFEGEESQIDLAKLTETR